MAVRNNSGSKGLFAGIEETGKEVKEIKSQESERVEEVKSEKGKKDENKRSYSLKPTTIKKLQELKVFLYDDTNVTYNDIVDEAICNLYDKKKAGK
jgi:hypothetical protein